MLNGSAGARTAQNASQFAYLECRRCNRTRTRHVILFDGTAKCLKHENSKFRRKKFAERLRSGRP